MWRLMLPNCNTSVSNSSSGVESMIKKCLHWQEKSSQHLQTVILCHWRLEWIIPINTSLYEEEVHIPNDSGTTVSIKAKHTKPWSTKNHFLIKPVRPLSHFGVRTEMQNQKLIVEQLKYFVLSIHNKGWCWNIYHRVTSSC